MITVLKDNIKTVKNDRDEHKRIIANKMKQIRDCVNQIEEQMIKAVDDWSTK